MLFRLTCHVRMEEVAKRSLETPETLDPTEKEGLEIAEIEIKQEPVEPFPPKRPLKSSTTGPLSLNPLPEFIPPHLTIKDEGIKLEPLQVTCCFN